MGAGDAGKRGGKDVAGVYRRLADLTFHSQVVQPLLIGGDVLHLLPAPVQTRSHETGNTATATLLTMK